MLAFGVKCNTTNPPYMSGNSSQARVTDSAPDFYLASPFAAANGNNRAIQVEGYCACSDWQVANRATGNAAGVIKWLNEDTLVAPAGQHRPLVVEYQSRDFAGLARKIS